VAAVVGTTWRRSARALTRVTPLGILVCVPQHAAPLQLEGAAALVFDTLAANATTTELVARIGERVGQDPEAIDRDVRASIDALGAIGLIEAVSAHA
jgi:hypothetical protein